MTPQEIRNIRLKNDYQQMYNIKGSIIDWVSLKGTTPFIEEYEITINIKTIISSSPSYRNQHKVILTIPPTYPRNPPEIRMTTTPKPFHPNWYRDGRWCSGSDWHMSEGLGDFVIRMIRTLQFDPDITNPNSPADTEANAWYNSASSKTYLPCDTTPLPDPANTQIIPEANEPKKFAVQEKKKFNIQ
jgi:ubiquitin-protein ligase